MLSQHDVARLLADPSPVNRADTAEKLARRYDQGGLSPKEAALAEDIFRIMVHDAEVRVREALSRNLAGTTSLPRDVALALARDVAAVSLPMLERSAVLTEEDLITIVRARDPAKQAAIAHRPSVSEPLAAALVAFGDERVVTELLNNRGAEISEETFGKVMDTHGNSNAVTTAAVHRGSLPVTIAERLDNLVSEVLRRHLLTHHELPEAVATDLVLQARERAIVGLSSEADETSVEQLVRQMHANGRLTPSIILRALCMGDIAFTEMAFAQRVGIPLRNARTLFHDRGDLGFKNLFDRAAMPRHLYPVMRAAIDIAQEMDYDGAFLDRERYARRMIERILTMSNELGVDFENDDLDYLLNKMSSLPSDAMARHHAPPGAPGGGAPPDATATPADRR